MYILGGQVRDGSFAAGGQPGQGSYPIYQLIAKK